MKTIFYIISSLFIISCSRNENINGSEESSSDFVTVINEPFEGDFINDTLFTINPREDNVLKTPNGSSIIIDANSIVNNEGEVESKKIEVSFNQYHSVLDVISSGIPMDYDTLDKKYSFETAGMFTIKAKNIKGKTLKIKEGKQIKVNLASDKKDEQFNFYQLNEQTGNWTYENNKTSIKKNENYIQQPKIIKPTKCTSKDPFILDFDFDLSNYSELEIFKGIVWEYTGQHDSLDPSKKKYQIQNGLTLA